MDSKNIFIKKSEINVSVVKVGTKKLTKSLLEQINYWLPFDNEYNFKGESIFGYVKIFESIHGQQTEKLIVIGVKNGNLYKFNLSEISYVARFKPDAHYKYIANNYMIENLCGGIDFINPKFISEHNEFLDDCIPMDSEIKDLVTKDGLENINRKVENVSAFLNEIYKYQVYI